MTLTDLKLLAIFITIIELIVGVSAIDGMESSLLELLNFEWTSYFKHSVPLPLVLLDKQERGILIALAPAGIFSGGGIEGNNL